MRDGQTPLAASYFNPVWQDLDIRIAALEQLQIDWKQAVDEISKFGLDRINAALIPVVEQATELLDQLINDAKGFRESLMAEIRPHIVKPDVLEVEYDAQGRVTRQVERTLIGDRSTVCAYDDQGRVQHLTVEFAGIRRIETITWTADGRLAGMTATEEPLEGNP